MDLSTPVTYIIQASPPFQFIPLLKPYGDIKAVFFTKFGRSNPFVFFKLPHEMNLTAISTERREGKNAHVAVCQVEFCKL